MARAGAGAGAGVGVRASKIALKIRYKSFLEYWETLVAAEDFGSVGSLGYSEKSDLRGGEELGGATEGAIEGATEGAMEGMTEKRSWRERLRSWPQVILVQTFF